MQTTLLGLAIAFILALIAALVGPLFIDWNQYKPQFEAEAARVIGAPVRVEGKLDARLLPAPILRLGKLAIGKPGDTSKVSADSLDVEFSLGSLLRGQWRASELTLKGFALDIGLDKHGRIDWPSGKGSFNLGALAIDRLNINGRVDLHDTASGGHLVLDDLVFSGDVRELASTMRGEGHVRIAGAQTPFRLSTGQTADNPGTRLKFSLDPGERPLAADLDGSLTFDDRSPRFDGTLTLARGVDTPWRIATKVKASPASASFDNMEWGYGPEDVALKWNGAGSAQFSASPKVQLKLSAQQLDADQLLAKGERVTPFDLAARLREFITTASASPVPSQIDVSVDQVTLGGRPVQNLVAALRGDRHGWTIDKFELSAPGNTKVVLNGAVKRRDGFSRFDGPLTIDSKFSQSFQDWLLGQPLVAYRFEAPLSISAKAALDEGGIDLSDFKMIVDGNSLEGHVTQNNNGIVAALRSSSFDFGNFSDIDGALRRLKAASPSRVKIALDIAQATVRGRNAGPMTAETEYRADAQTEKSDAIFDVAVSRADLAPWLGMPLGVSDLTAKMRVSGERVSFSAIDGKFGETRVKGSLAVTRAEEPDLDGDVTLDAADVGPLIKAALGGSDRASTDPLGQGILQGWRGRIAFKAGHANLPGGTVLSDPGGVLRRDGQSLYIDDLKAGLGGGDVSVKSLAAHNDSGASVSAQVQIANADSDALKYRSLMLPEGKASLQMTLSSEGRSLAALGNALSGSGVLTLDGARIEGLDSGVFDATIAASDGGQTLDDAKLKATIEPMLAQGAVVVDAAQIPFEIKDGRLRVNATTLETGNARVVVSGGYDMPADQADLRAVLTSSSLGTQTSRPAIQIDLHGTPDALTRSLDVTGLSSWLSLRAIERETKRLDQLEGKSAPSPAGEQPHSEAQPSAPASVPVIKQAKPVSAPKATVAPAANSPPSVTADDRAIAPLPPPIIITPAPGTRAKKSRPPAPQGLPPVGSAF